MCLSASLLNKREGCHGLTRGLNGPPVFTEQLQTHAGDSVKCHNFTIFSDINTETLESKVNCIKLPYLEVSRHVSSEVRGGWHLGTRRRFTSQKVTALLPAHKTNRKLIVTLDYKGLHAPQKKNKTAKWAQSCSGGLEASCWIVLLFISH